jgi:hypothetical protein
MGMLSSYLVMEKGRRASATAADAEAAAKEEAFAAGHAYAVPAASVAPALRTAEAVVPVQKASVAPALRTAEAVVPEKKASVAPALRTAEAAVPVRRRYSGKSAPRTNDDLGEPARKKRMPTADVAGPAAELVHIVDVAVPAAEPIADVAGPAAEPIQIVNVAGTASEPTVDVAEPAAEPPTAVLAPMPETLTLRRKMPTVNHEKTRRQYLVRSGNLGLKSVNFKYGSAAEQVQAEADARRLLQTHLAMWERK